MFFLLEHFVAIYLVHM